MISDLVGMELQNLFYLLTEEKFLEKLVISYTLRGFQQEKAAHIVTLQTLIGLEISQ